MNQATGAVAIIASGVTLLNAAKGDALGAAAFIASVALLIFVLGRLNRG